MVERRSIRLEDSRGDYFLERWNEAYEKCRESLNDNDLHYIHTIQDCDDFKRSIDQMHSQFVHMSTHTIINRLNPALGSIVNFLTLLAVAMGSTPANVAILWGLLSLVVKAASGMTVVLTETIDMLNSLGHDLEILQILETSFENDPRMGDELIGIFVEIMSFWTRAARFLRRKYELSAIKQWPDVKKDFERSSQNIKNRSQRLKEKADALASASRPAAILQAMENYGAKAENIGINPIVSTPSITESPRPRHNIPVPRNSHFLARQKELSDIEKALTQSSTSPKVKSFALWGLGGVGKTQLAVEYAYQALDTGPQVVLWVNCETGLSISASFMELSLMLRLPGALNNDNTTQNRLLVLNWLRTTHEPWLLILDNVEDHALARDCWPVASQGSVLVTSRRPIVAIDPAAGGVEVNQFTNDDGASLLLRIVNKYPYDTKEEAAARQLSAELGGHGLALGVMAAQIHLRSKSFTEFVNFYLRYRERLHSNPSIEAGNTHSLRTCWHSAFEALAKEPSAILGLLSYMAPDGIPENIFRPRSRPFPQMLEFCKDELDFEDALSALLATSLIRREPQTCKLHLHRLIQFEYRSHLRDPGNSSAGYSAKECFLSAADLLYEAFPKQINGGALRNEAEQCKDHIQHVLFLCAQWQEHKFQADYQGQFTYFTKLLTNAGWYLLETGAWSEEIELMNTAFESCEAVNQLEFAHLCNTHACVQVERGKAEAALGLLSKALNIRLKLLGDTHIDTGHTYNNFGNSTQQAYVSLDSIKQAVLYYLKAIDIFEGAAEDERIKFSYIPFFNISRAYRLLGQYDLALQYLDKAKESITATFPAGSHFDATEKVHRANIVFDQGHKQEAEKLWRQAYKIFVSSSETHPATISVQLKLATIEMRRGEVDTAITTLKRLLLVCELREQAKGDKGEIARVVRRLAEAMGLKGLCDEEARLFQTAERMRKEIQKGREWQLEDCDRAYDILVWNEYW